MNAFPAWRAAQARQQRSSEGIFVPSSGHTCGPVGPDGMITMYASPEDMLRAHPEVERVTGGCARVEPEPTRLLVGDVAPAPPVTPAPKPTTTAPPYDAMYDARAWAVNAGIIGIGGLVGYSAFKLAGGGVVGIAAAVVAAPVAVVATTFTAWLVVADGMKWMP